MKTKYWVMLLGILACLCAVLSLPLLGGGETAWAEIYSGGELVKTVSLGVDQEFIVGGHNTVTVSGGKIAVTWADCPDGYCMARGYCASGPDIVCLPNRLVIRFTGEPEVDAVAGQ